MRLLIASAFINPAAVGEPRWCYDLAKALSERLDTIIISQTPANGSSTIASLFPNARVYECTGWKLDFLDRRLKALIKPNYLTYYRFARHVISNELKPGEVTCAHHFGPLGMRYPTPLRDSGIPYVVGPVGGSLPLPAAFRNCRTGDPWYYKLRDLDGLRFRYDPLLRASYRNAEYLVGAGDYVEDVLQHIPIKRFLVHSQRIAPPVREDIERLIEARKRRTGPLRLLIASRLIFSKGIHCALQALGRINDRLPDWKLDILGDGVYRKELERISEAHGLANRVKFHGHVLRADVDAFYHDADIFLFPTIREPSGAVIFESMSWGLPIVAADYGGPATHVKPDYGIKVPVSSPEAFVEGIADAVQALARSADRRAQMGRRAVATAREKHSVDEMVDFFVDIYRRLGPSAELSAAMNGCR